MEATETTPSCRNLRGVNLLEEGLLRTAAMRRNGRFGQHAWCQSVLVLLNLAVVTVMMLISGWHNSEDCGKALEGLLCTVDGAHGARNSY